MSMSNKKQNLEIHLSNLQEKVDHLIHHKEELNQSLSSLKTIYSDLENIQTRSTHLDTHARHALKADTGQIFKDLENKDKKLSAIVKTLKKTETSSRKEQLQHEESNQYKKLKTQVAIKSSTITPIINEILELANDLKEKIKINSNTIKHRRTHALKFQPNDKDRRDQVRRDQRPRGRR